MKPFVLSITVVHRSIQLSWIHTLCSGSIHHPCLPASVVFCCLYLGPLASCSQLIVTKGSWIKQKSQSILISIWMKMNRQLKTTPLFNEQKHKWEAWWSMLWECLKICQKDISGWWRKLLSFFHNFKLLVNLGMDSSCLPMFSFFTVVIFGLVGYPMPSLLSRTGS